MNNLFLDTCAGIFILGICAGIIITSALLVFTPNSTSRSISAIEECEKILPRNQHCIISAIPKTSE